MRKNTFDDADSLDSSSTAVPYFGSDLDQKISDETYLSNLYSSNIVSNLRSRSIKDSEVNTGIRKCYLPDVMTSKSKYATHIESLYKYYNIPIPESWTTPNPELFIATRSNGVATMWWTRSYGWYTPSHGYINSFYTTTGNSNAANPSSQFTIRPIINLSNYTKVRSENDNYYID